MTWACRAGSAPLVLVMRLLPLLTPGFVGDAGVRNAVFLDEQVEWRWGGLRGNGGVRGGARAASRILVERC